MPTSDANNKIDRLQELQRLFHNEPERRWRTPEIATRLGVSESTALRYLDEFSATERLPITKDGQCWVLGEHSTLDLPAIKLNVMEAAALFVSARLLSQLHDEQNRHVVEALVKLVGAMPSSLATHQQRLVEIARERQRSWSGTDRSAVFEAIAIGWARQCKVRIRYVPPRGSALHCDFEPYWLEPSGIGRTIYILGKSTPPGELRTFKFERIERAEVLKKEHFEIPANFNGPDLLKRAWGVMYGEERPVEVRLRFTTQVEKRVKETLWHPTQQIEDTPDGCILTLTIGDTLEIENWIRGWGPDCEVLSPAPLREHMAQQARRVAHLYHPGPDGPDDDPDTTLLSQLFGG